jgi:hypothetical protein
MCLRERADNALKVTGGRHAHVRAKHAHVVCAPRAAPLRAARRACVQRGRARDAYAFTLQRRRRPPFPAASGEERAAQGLDARACCTALTRLGPHAMLSGAERSQQHAHESGRHAANSPRLGAQLATASPNQTRCRHASEGKLGRLNTRTPAKILAWASSVASQTFLGQDGGRKTSRGRDPSISAGANGVRGDLRAPGMRVLSCFVGQATLPCPWIPSTKSWYERSNWVSRGPRFCTAPRVGPKKPKGAFSGC